MAADLSLWTKQLSAHPLAVSIVSRVAGQESLTVQCSNEKSVPYFSEHRKRGSTVWISIWETSTIESASALLFFTFLLYGRAFTEHPGADTQAYAVNLCYRMSTLTSKQHFSRPATYISFYAGTSLTPTPTTLQHFPFELPSLPESKHLPVGRQCSLRPRILSDQIHG